MTDDTKPLTDEELAERHKYIDFAMLHLDELVSVTRATAIREARYLATIAADRKKLRVMELQCDGAEAFVDAFDGERVAAHDEGRPFNIDVLIAARDVYEDNLGEVVRLEEEP